MDTYSLYLFLHIVGALVWVGAAALMALLGARVVLAHDPMRTAAYARDSEWLGLRLYLPANLVVLVSAVLLVHRGSWSYDPLWIELGLAGFAVSFLVGALFFAPQWARVGKAVATEGAGSPSVRARIRRLLVVTNFDVGVLLAVVFVMTVKPSGDEHAALAVAAALPVIGVLIGLALRLDRDTAAADPVLPAAGRPAGRRSAG